MATETRPTGRLVLLASPLLGPATWAPVAGELVRRGHRVTVAAGRGRVRTPADVLAGLLAAIPDEPGLVLVPHSNSGLYVAALAARLHVAQVLFVDAGLPGRQAQTPAAPPGLVEHLAGLADAEGLLPAWTDWWAAETLDELFPDSRTRADVEREQRQLPLDYFRASIASPAGWDALQAAYLAFGGTYAEEIALARGRGWPTETLPGRHLHQLVDPVGVSDALERLLAQTRRTGRACLPRGANRGDPGEA